MGSGQHKDGGQCTERDIFEICKTCESLVTYMVYMHNKIMKVEKLDFILTLFYALLVIHMIN